MNLLSRNRILAVVFVFLAGIPLISAEPVGQHDAAPVHFVNLLVKNLPDGEMVLTAFQKTSWSIIDRVMAVNGSFYFSFPEERHPGTYRIYLGEPDFSGRKESSIPFIEFIWSMESFTIVADYTNLEGSVIFENSRENEVLGLFREYENRYEQKMSALYPLIDRYPEGDDFYSAASSHFSALQLERDQFIMTLTQQHQDLYATKLILAYRSLILDPSLKGKERIDFLKYHFFDRSQLNEPSLINSPVYNHKIIEYLSLYRDPSFTFSEQEEAFMEATDVIMARVSNDSALRSFVVEFLLEGFNSLQMERAQTYMADNYVNETCTTDLVQLAMQRVEGFRKMEIGATAPDFRVVGEGTKRVQLSAISSDYVVVLFWASHCSHCVQMMPRLREWYLEERPAQVEMVAISIDSVKSAWLDYLKESDLPWINAHEPLGWEGKSAADYNIYATPTIFVLDRKRTILAKPLTYRELKKDIDKLTSDRK